MLNIGQDEEIIIIIIRTNICAFSFCYSVSWPMGCARPPPLCWGRCEKGSPPCHHGGPGYYHRENLNILHKKSCIFVHICITVMAIGNKRYSQFNAQNTRQSGIILGTGHSLRCPPTKLLEGDMYPRPPGFRHLWRCMVVSELHSQSTGNRFDSRRTCRFSRSEHRHCRSHTCHQAV